MKALSLGCVKVTQNSIKSLAHTAPPPPPTPLFLHQTEAQKAGKMFFGPFMSRFGSGTENVSTVTGK